MIDIKLKKVQENKKTDFTNLALNISLPESSVNIIERNRSSLFTWRGQFHPQLVEQILLNYASPNDKIFDPFLGSGTVLFECGVMGLKASGCEINPAAVSFAKIYELMNVSKAKINEALFTVEQFVSQYTNTLPFPEDINIDTFETKLIELLKVEEDKITAVIILALITGMDFEIKKLDLKRVNNVWGTLRSNVENLPFSRKGINCYNRDARKTKLRKNSIDMVITSPPYINVFNYHQNYRKSIEKTGVDVLSVARSEIGSNRKFRPNRFMTVIQYCIDMGLVFSELQRICKKNAKVIFIVGKESNIRKTPFKNADLILKVAEVCGFKLEGQQERVFMNKFGESIYEEILRFSNHNITQDNIIEKSRFIGQSALDEASNYCDEIVRPEIMLAIEKSYEIKPSSFLGE